MAEAAETAAAAGADTPEHKWYIVHTYSGFEKKVAQAIRDGAVRKKMSGMFEDVVVPSRRWRRCAAARRCRASANSCRATC